MARILIVDDVAQNRYMLQVLFSAHGHDTETADNGAVALEKARLHPPDLIITDLLMPVMDGFELCRRWRQDPRLGSRPIVIYTSVYTEEKDIEFGLGLGARLYLKKPMAPEELIRVVDDLLQQPHDATATGPANLVTDETEFLRQHKQVLARKLESKVAELNAANAALRAEQEELRHSEARLRAITENTTVYLYEISLDGIIEYANRTYPDLLFSQVIGTRLLDWFPEHMQATIQELLDITCKTGQAQSTEYTIADPKGILHTYSASFSPVIAEGRLQRLILTAVDITERVRTERELERHRKQLQALIDERTHDLGQALKELTVFRWYADASLTGFGWTRIEDLKLAYVNDSLRKMLGVGRTDLALNTRFPDYMTAESVQFLETEALPQVLREGSWQGELTLVNTAGETLPTWHDVLLMLDKKGQPVYFAHAVTDIREQKRIADQLREARDAAESASQAKSLFLANMSHEIRTPLNAVLNLAHLCLQGKLEPKQRDYVEKIYRSGSSLLGIVNDILDYSKIEAGKLSLEQIPFSLAEVLEDLSTLLRHRAAEKNLELVFTHNEYLPLNLIGDPLRLSQILINLLSNAIKFTTSGEVRLDIDIESIADDKTIELRFSVIDNGIGMTEEQMGRLFQPFNQADVSTTRRYGGTGLGLAISKRLVELMGGNIVVYSQPGRGTTFMFNARFAIDRQAGSFRVPPNLAGQRALIVESHASTADFINRVLNKFGFSTEWARDSAEATAKLSSDPAPPYSLIVIDDSIVPPNCLTSDDTILAPLIRGTQAHVVSLIHNSDHGTACNTCSRLRYACLQMPVSLMSFQACLENLYSLKPEAMPPPVRAGTPPNLAGCRILMVEDNPLNQEILKGLIEPTGATAEVAEDGVIAVAMVANHAPDHYDVVLMDIQMPEMDGLEATSRIRDDAAYANLPILAMTAHALDEERQRSLQAGMNDHLTKPVVPEQLYAALARWCRRKPTAGPASEGSDTVVEPGPALPELPGIDVAGALARVRGKTALYLSMLKRFADGSDAEIMTITRALGQSDTEMARRAAHKLKGSAGNLGLIDVYQAASELEQALKQATGNYMDKSGILKASLDKTTSLLRERLAGRW
ncbi:hypothetical protein EDC61_103177 [Sulfuritortus calidifontis]|uniref:Sensory/regulatory protein RpfC n=1 Tax=Sulfuritortus calidifontis TaxID=1914471 RepID=A0A4R3JXK2_9PROT|nr:response regulator [Sulfuritortus calidifontis]TCS73054.1 hypothetical protein EDC61_103177 [Sulfuritortus calidifontis]